MRPPGGWDRTQVYVMSLYTGDLGMWWFESEAKTQDWSDGMWRRIIVYSNGNIEYGAPNTNYGPGSFLSGGWMIRENPSPIEFNQLCHSPWIAHI